MKMPKIIDELKLISQIRDLNTKPSQLYVETPE